VWFVDGEQLLPRDGHREKEGLLRTLIGQKILPCLPLSDVCIL
jgi:hypothetical protein